MILISLWRVLTDLSQIRNKRLAKLGSQAPSQSPANSQEPTVGPSSLESQKPSSNPTASPKDDQQPRSKVGNPSSPKSQNPFSQLVSVHANAEGPRINITSAASNQNTARTRARSSESSKGASSRLGETLEEWEDKALGGIFRLTLNKSTTRDAQGHSLRFVAGVRDDLEEQNEPIRFSTAVLDQAILEAASNSGKSTPLDYLLACWKRVMRVYKGFKRGSAEDPKYNIVKEARRLCMSYCIFAVTMPDMFGYQLAVYDFRSWSANDRVVRNRQPLTP